MRSPKYDIPSTLLHRQPFLMIDKVIEVVEGKRVCGLKNITENEWYISDQNKSMPNIMIVEALAQLSAFVSIGEDNSLGFLTSIKGTEFFSKAFVGDQVYLYYEMKRIKKGFVIGQGHAKVNEKTILKIEEISVYKPS